VTTVELLLLLKLRLSLLILYLLLCLPLWLLLLASRLLRMTGGLSMRLHTTAWDLLLGLLLPWLLELLLVVFSLLSLLLWLPEPRTWRLL
jgi:hypothetical protein